MMEKEEGKFYGIVNGEKVPFEIPVDGSLGLLAFGDLGLMAWRKVREEAQAKTKDERGLKEKNADGKE